MAVNIDRNGVVEYLREKVPSFQVSPTQKRLTEKTNNRQKMIDDGYEHAVETRSPYLFMYFDGTPLKPYLSWTERYCEIKLPDDIVVNLVEGNPEEPTDWFGKEEIKAQSEGLGQYVLGLIRKRKVNPNIDNFEVERAEILSANRFGTYTLKDYKTFQEEVKLNGLEVYSEDESIFRMANTLLNKRDMDGKVIENLSGKLRLGQDPHPIWVSAKKTIPASAPYNEDSFLKAVSENMEMIRGLQKKYPYSDEGFMEAWKAHQKIYWCLCFDVSEEAYDDFANCIKKALNKA